MSIRVAGKRLDVDDLFGRDAELLDHFVAADPFHLHRVEHRDAGANELHQVFVGRHDGNVTACVHRLFGIGRDQIVGLVAIELDAGDVEGLHGVADERKLRKKLFRRRRPLGLVLRVDLVAKRLASRVKDHRNVRRSFGRLGLTEELPKHCAKAVHGADRQAVRRPSQRRKRVERAEDITGTVDQIDVAALDDRNRFRRGDG